MLEQSRILFAISQSQSIFSNVHLSVKILIRLVTLTQHIIHSYVIIFIYLTMHSTLLLMVLSVPEIILLETNTNNRGSLMWIDLKVGTCTTGLQ